MIHFATGWMLMITLFVGLSPAGKNAAAMLGLLILWALVRYLTRRSREETEDDVMRRNFNRKKDGSSS